MSPINGSQAGAVIYSIRWKIKGMETKINMQRSFVVFHSFLHKHVFHSDGKNQNTIKKKRLLSFKYSITCSCWMGNGSMLRKQLFDSMEAQDKFRPFKGTTFLLIFEKKKDNGSRYG